MARVHVQKMNLFIHMHTHCMYARYTNIQKQQAIYINVLTKQLSYSVLECSVHAI